jgi:hypothetical protein
MAKLSAAIVGLAANCVLAGCVATQMRENTLNMEDQISHLRETQVLENISHAINDHDLVPAQIVLGQGQATVAVAASPTVQLPDFLFSKATKQLNVTATDTWTAQWQFTTVTDAADLRNLRDVYALIASTDEQWDQLQVVYKDHRDFFATPGANSGAQPSLDGGIVPLGEPPAPVAAPASPAPANPPAPPRGPWTPVAVISFHEALRMMTQGDSIGCMRFQGYELNGAPRREKTGGLPFHRFLYWRSGEGAWAPEAPDRAITSLGRFGDYELGTTSRACFDDFVIIAQGATPNANAGAQTPKATLYTQ